MSRIRSIALPAALAIVALASGILLSRALLTRQPEAPALASGTLLTPPRELPPIDLIDHTGARFDAQRLQNRWTLMFFGFTSCPDVCPNTMGMLARVDKQLADVSAERQVVLVSVDPERDSPEQLAKYVRFFSAEFIGVTGPQAKIDEFTRALGVPVARRALGESGYTVDHSGSIFLIDPTGRLHALFSPPITETALVADLHRLIDSAQSR